MDRKSTQVFCFVISAMIFMFSGRDVEAGVVRNVREHVTESSDDVYPFIDGLRIRTQRPAIDSSDLEEPNTDTFPFIDGVRKIPRRFGLPEIDLNEGTFLGSDGEFPFKDGLRRTTEAPAEAESILDEESVVGIDAEYPFRDGLRRRTKAPGEPQSIFDDEVKVGNNGNFPFIDGLRRRVSTTTTTTTTKPQVQDFEKNSEEYPFINGLQRHPPVSKSSEELSNLINDLPLINRIHLCASGKFFPFVDCYRINSTKSILKPTSDNDSGEYPLFLNGLIGKNSHPIKKRSVGANLDDTTFLDQRRESSHASSNSKSTEEATSTQSDSYPFVNGGIFPSVPTVHEDISFNDVHRFSSGRSPSHHQSRAIPKPTRFKVTFGERKQGDT